MFIFPAPINTHIIIKNLLEERYGGDYIDQICIVAIALDICENNIFSILMY